MKCQYCGFDLPEESVFCYNCGKKLVSDIVVDLKEPGVYTANEEISAENSQTTYEVPVVEESQAACEESVVEESQMTYEDAYAQGGSKYCPFCGSANEFDAVFCCACGQNMEAEAGTSAVNYEQTEDEASGKKNIRKTLTIAGIVVVAAVVLFAVVKIAGAVFGGGDESIPYVTYIKDEQIVNIDADSRKKEPVEYKGDIGEDFSVYSLYDAVQYSKDGKYMCYPSNMDSESFRLNMIQLGKDPSDAVKIESGVVRYILLDNNKILYKKGDTLYINDIKGNKEKVASDVNSFFVDTDQKNIFWTEADEGDEETTYDMYYIDMNLKKDKTKLMSGYDTFTKINDKLFTFIEDGTLYVVENLGEKEKVAKDVENIYVSSDSDNYFFYTVVENDTIKASDYVDDDMKASDAQMEEPDSDDYVKEEVQKNSDGRYEKIQTTDWDAYYAAWDEYELKEDRDYMRELLNETTFDIELASLYYYDNGKTELLEEKFLAVSSYEDNKILYSKYIEEEVEKIKLSELYSIDEIYDLYSDNRSSTRKLCYAEGSKVTEYDGEFVFSAKLVADKGIAYGLMKEKEDESADILVSLNLKSGEITEIAEDVDHIEGVRNGDVYYIADVKDENGDLYCNDVEVDSDVETGSVVFADEDSDTILYQTDYNHEKYRYTLKMYQGKEAVEVADDVYQYVVFNEKQIAVLMDYNIDRGEGDLNLYTGKAELTELDTDVTWLLNSYR